jgi:hypothetical protein
MEMLTPMAICDSYELFLRQDHSRQKDHESIFNTSKNDAYSRNLVLEKYSIDSKPDQMVFNSHESKIRILFIKKPNVESPTFNPTKPHGRQNEINHDNPRGAKMKSSLQVGAFMNSPLPNCKDNLLNIQNLYLEASTALHLRELMRRTGARS